MREQIEKLLSQSLDALREAGTLNTTITPRVTPAKGEGHGDWASNVAMALAKGAGMSPLDLARDIVNHLPADEAIAKVEVAPPGFINFHIKQQSAVDALRDYARPSPAPIAAGGKQPKVLLEFVSANPTGPLHVGHGRGAAYGACLASLLTRQGYDVACEYYVNDAGRQMDVLAVSVWLRYLALGDSAGAAAGEDNLFPAGAYGGDYVWDVAAEARRLHKDRLERDLNDVFTRRREIGDKAAAEAHLTELIVHTKDLLGDAYQDIHHLAMEFLRRDIEKELKGFGVRYERWFSESSLAEDVDEAIALLDKKGCLYVQDGALWFRSEQYGDEKDRVVRRQDGAFTYFATDIAYHLNKYKRGYDRMINIWGADHHGYVPRIKAALTALGLDAAKLEIILVQFVNLWRGGERLSMSTRAGQFVRLRDLSREVGVDAARFFYVTRKPSQHIDFDLDLAKSRSNENPMYYIQYAHARICSVFRQATEQGFAFDPAVAKSHRLEGDDEIKLMKMLAGYDDALRAATRRMEPHHLIQFLRELSAAFHAYYNRHRFLTDDVELRNTRLLLIDALRNQIAGGLHLLGVSAPEKM